jgi:hypothetical protein
MAGRRLRLPPRFGWGAKSKRFGAGEFSPFTSDIWRQAVGFSALLLTKRKSLPGASSIFAIRFFPFR